MEAKYNHERQMACLNLKPTMSPPQADILFIHLQSIADFRYPKNIS